MYVICAWVFVEVRKGIVFIGVGVLSGFELFEMVVGNFYFLEEEEGLRVDDFFIFKINLNVVFNRVLFVI